MKRIKPYHITKTRTNIVVCLSTETRASMGKRKEKKGKEKTNPRTLTDTRQVFINKRIRKRL
jgi:hypothetical protein